MALSLDMLATHVVCMPLFAGSGLNLWPPALLYAPILALPGILTAWIGSRVQCSRMAGPVRCRRSVV